MLVTIKNYLDQRMDSSSVTTMPQRNDGKYGTLGSNPISCATSFILSYSLLFYSACVQISHV